MGRRRQREDKFSTLVKAYNTSNRNVNVVRLTHDYFLLWLTNLAVVVYLSIGGHSVISGDESLGLFLAHLGLIYKIGKSWGSVYHSLLQLQGIFPSMFQVFRLMNLETDFNEEKSVAEHRHEATIAAIARGENVQRMPIYMEGVKAYVIDAVTKGTSKKSTELNFAGSLAIEPGELICLTGPHGEGKTTLLKILGGCRPQGIHDLGNVLVPAHLRLMFVSHSSLFLQGTLLYNLTFGAKDDEACIDRVVRIVRSLGLSQHIIDLLRSD